MGVAPDELAIASIRRATRERHASLEGVLQLVSALSHRRYLEALRGFELFHSEWEPRIDAALPEGLRHWFESRSRLSLLRQDLAQLDNGCGMQGRVTSACRNAVAEIDLTSAASTFGSLYVLEGSALGGQVIAGAARATLGLDRNNGAAYFNGLDRHTAARWGSFKGLFEEQVGTEPLPRQQACSAACQTFDALIITFTEQVRDHAAA
jgi:heme oxygenase